MKNKLRESRIFKNISKLGFIIIGCLVLASFSPSLDGRAIVVEPGVFPEGLFAKTVGYLPGDIISVTNITGDATIDILVIGALDPSEGVAIMLSPEAADAIGISRNTNNIVKITKRSNQDERVYGSAVIASNKEDKTPVKEAEPVLEPVTEPVKPEETSVVPEPVEEPFEEETPFEEPVEEAPVEETAEEEWQEPDYDSKTTIPATEPEEEIYSQPVKEEAVEEEPVIEYEYFDDEELPDYTESQPVEEKAPEVIEETPVPEEEEEAVEEEEPVIYEEFSDEGIDDLPPEEEESFETISATEEEAEEEAPLEEKTPAEEEAVEEEVIKKLLKMKVSMILKKKAKLL